VAPARAVADYTRASFAPDARGHSTTADQRACQHRLRKVAALRKTAHGSSRRCRLRTAAPRARPEREAAAQKSFPPERGNRARHHRPKPANSPGPRQASEGCHQPWHQCVYAGPFSSTPQRRSRQSYATGPRSAAPPGAYRTPPRNGIAERPPGPPSPRSSGSADRWVDGLSLVERLAISRSRAGGDRVGDRR